ncbi:hypothetical protein GBAR_LOCUS24915 [Geodia barretti]|uniref:Ras-associating domain-containing protein n=1 Tax=Geodia barretti TaxID=519541 RepID=A0AA35XB70_GEOBA|nr:hypothetical protein GBAR_LOCUS24915 [Geodia barretti]
MEDRPTTIRVYPGELRPVYYTSVLASKTTTTLVSLLLIQVIRLALERLQIFEDKTLYELHEGCPGDEENWTLLKEGETKITTHAQLQPQTIIIQINPRRACAARVTVVVP